MVGGSKKKILKPFLNKNIQNKKLEIFLNKILWF
jgi:hypothetical protein